MKNFRKRAFPLVPVIALALYIAIGAVKARPAALLSPCDEQQLAQPSSKSADVTVSPVVSATFAANCTLSSISTSTSKLLQRAKQRKRSWKLNPSFTVVKSSILTLLSWQYPYLGINDVSTSA